ncbi:erythromycin esterase family protein [Solwaraspora sp. WMMD792]|uniref:erythromycin esterase family protein n=1 Tax=Solwaraspora sp. WMMD792 TaxID=3016099 RepID=UPI0024181349|nr:erythromycin esterase family protein [Solwaraspora sp. WMMD792]MDG4770127.1 erythromycin esterase family protein [Solwaraspora sp. WMMD792]
MSVGAPAAVVDWLSTHARPMQPYGDPPWRDVVTDIADGLLPRRADHEAADTPTVIGLAPTTRESVEVSELQVDLLQALVTRGVRTVVLQDTTEIGERLDHWARAGDRSASGPEAILADAWGPWRTESLRRALIWLRARNATHPADQVEIRGITRPAAEPADYDRVLALTTGTRDHERISALLATIRVAHDGGEHVERAHGRWTGEPFVDLARQARTATAAVLDPGSDAATRALAALDRIVRFHAAPLSRGRSGEDEETAAADQLVEHLRATGRRAVVWDGIGHLAARGTSFGSRLREHLGTGYRCVLTTFGSGRIRDFHLPAPRPGSLDQTLDHVAAKLGAGYAVNLTAAPKPETVGRWLAGRHAVRLISGMYRPDEDERHYFALDDLAGSVDVLLHLPEISPVRYVEPPEPKG